MGIIGAILIKKKVPFPLVAIITAPIHAILEGLIVIPFLGFNYMVYVVAGGTLIHHLVDALIAFGLVKALVKAKSFDLIHSKRAA